MNDLLGLLETKSTLINAVGALASTIVALIALLVSVVSVAVSVRSLKIQRQHNVLSVSPLPEVVYGDYRRCLEVKIRNNGSGPLVIKSVAVFNDAKSLPSVIEWVKNASYGWTDFTQRLKNRSVLPGDEIILLKLAIDNEHAANEEYYAAFAHQQNWCRAILSSLTIRVDYTDIYETPFASYSRSMDWFGRKWGSGDA